MINMETTLTMRQLLEAFKPAWKVAEKRDDAYRLALEEVWEDIHLEAMKQERAASVDFRLAVIMEKENV